MMLTVTSVKYLILIAISVVVYGSTTPTIAISGPRIAIEYNKIQLKCWTPAEHKHFQWSFSPNASDAHYKPLAAKELRLNANRTVLTIQPVLTSHVGSYRCCVTETVCSGMYLAVLSLLDDHATLSSTTHFSTTNSGVLDVPNRGSFSIAIYHPPFAGAEVYNDREPTVSFCEHFRTHSKECDEHRSADTLSYTVRNVTPEEGGQFDIRIHGNRQVERFQLHVLVRGIPVVRMDNYNVLKSADHVSLLCRGFAYPAPNVTFSYRTCSATKMDTLLSSIPNTHCGRSIPLPQHSLWLSRLYHSANFEAIVPSWPIVDGSPGIVSCQVSNSEGTTAISTFLYVRNFLEPMLFRVVFPTDAVLYDDRVNITCQVDVYNFTDQLIIHHGGSSFKLKGRRHHYAWTVTYLAHITNGSQNEVSCVAAHRNGTVLANTLNLSIQYPSKPHIVSVNDTVNVTIPADVQLRLECDIDGTPTPDIMWFKNDDYLAHVHGHFIRVALEPDEERAAYRCLGTSRLGKAFKTWYIVQEDSMQWLVMGGVGIGVLFLLILISTIVWAVNLYRELNERQTVLEEQLNSNDDKV